ncbi:hypothetical protein [Terrisporobacter petrolearius]|uniref:hypothetical protein n=1 Tax=Terrisporobacter petrolearius TaxID=1460447 RepID=UPI0031CC8587
MISAIKWEMKKSMRIGVIILWLILLVSSYKFGDNSMVVNDMYASLFQRHYKLVPFYIFIMFTMLSGGFTIEYNSNMQGLIKSSKGGKDQFVLSKFIANGICLSIINVSILAAMVLRVVSIFGFKGLDLQLKDLWNFSSITNNITVLQMLLILSITLILGSFLVAAIGLYLSAINKKATIPFIVGSILVGLPIIETVPEVIRFNSPLYGMYSQQLIMSRGPISSLVVFIVMVLVGSTVLYKLTKKSFLKEL